MTTITRRTVTLVAVAVLGLGAGGSRHRHWPDLARSVRDLPAPPTRRPPAWAAVTA
jgi:hypothetical protein